MFRSRRSQPLSKQLGAVVLVLTLVLGLWLAPALAQTSVKAPVVLDGQKLFQISSSGEYSAQERADSINSELKNPVRASESIQVKVEQRNQLPTILLDGRYLLTGSVLDLLFPFGNYIAWLNPQHYYPQFYNTTLESLPSALL